jgi:hypothetical protein
MGWFSLFQTVTSFGLGPYSFSPGLLSVTKKTNNQIDPITGISPIRIIQPFIPVSCNLLTVTAIDGIIWIKRKRKNNMDKMVSPLLFVKSGDIEHPSPI